MVGSTIAARSLPAAGQGLGGLWQVTRAIKRWTGWICSERRNRGGISKWRALDDHLLADIGLTRGHIEYAEYASRFGRLPNGWSDGLCP